MKIQIKYIFGLLLLINVCIWIAVFQIKISKFRLIACDVGQGDSILAIYGNIEILTDGGNPNGKALECLSRYMPFWDRTVEVIVNTHPQLDHYGGLIEVFRHYKINYFVGNSIDASASEYQVLKKLVGGGGVVTINPLQGTSIRYGKMHYDIFFPTREFLAANSTISKLTSTNNSNSNVLGAYDTKNDPNDFSVQAVLSFGEFDALLTGDVGHNMAKIILNELDNLPQKKSIEYIKVPHHGSKYGLTGDYLEKFTPGVAVISVGAKNRYGHPTHEILDILNNHGVKTYRTDTDGDVIIESDGVNYWKK